MNSNLLMAAGAAYAIAGALLVVSSRVGADRRRTVPAYPAVLAKATAARLDARFGVGFAALGAALYALGAYGWTAPLSLWPYPAAAGLGALLAWSSARLISLRPVHRRRAQGARVGMFETHRSLTLRRAAEREMAAHQAREIARGPRDTRVVYLRRHWDRQWWSARLGASVETIEDAVSRVGPMAADVQRYLAQSRSATLAAAA